MAKRTGKAGKPSPFSNTILVTVNDGALWAQDDSQFTIRELEDGETVARYRLVGLFKAKQAEPTLEPIK